MTNYPEFLATKRRTWQGAGVVADQLPVHLFPWQAALVRWALEKGRAAIFADCGLGKTPMQLAWAQALGKRTLILAPLCVAEQTQREGAKFGVVVAYATDQAQVQTAITVTNYERLDKFDPRAFDAVVLDESSILKSMDGKTRTKLIHLFARTPYRLCCTATPAPNDIAELANHAEFLGLMTRPEFLATWFVHDDAGWRMKRPAVEPFYRWLSSWAVALRKPSDLGYEDAGFVSPPLVIRDVTVPSETVVGHLFPELGISGLSGRLAARRGSLPLRIQAAVDLVDDTRAPFMFWCGLNQESAALAKALPSAVAVAGSDSYAEKIAAVRAFAVDRTQRILISKAKILGFGMNFQHCADVVFVGIGDSYEMYYQCIRRSWRFGQTRPVHVSIVVSDAERFVVENVRRKEVQASAMTDQMIAAMRDYERAEVCS